jgi:hypothetical protein
VTTVQKFPFILDELGDLGGKKFALLIDEAHSSQGGKTTAKMHMALSCAPGDDEEDEESVEDAVNKLIESRKMLSNASYFAFTATPKNRTLELFGEHPRRPPKFPHLWPPQNPPVADAQSGLTLVGRGDRTSSSLRNIDEGKRSECLDATEAQRGRRPAGTWDFPA